MKKLGKKHEHELKCGPPNPVLARTRDDLQCTPGGFGVACFDFLLVYGSFDETGGFPAEATDVMSLLQAVAMNGTKTDKRTVCLKALQFPPDHHADVAGAIGGAFPPCCASMPGGHLNCATKFPIQALMLQRQPNSWCDR